MSVNADRAREQPVDFNRLGIESGKQQIDSSRPTNDFSMLPIEFGKQQIDSSGSTNDFST